VAHDEKDAISVQMEGQKQVAISMMYVVLGKDQLSLGGGPMFGLTP